MVRTKFTKILAATALIAGVGFLSAAHAATTTNQQILQCTLGTYVNITPDNTAVTTASIDVDSGNLTTPLTSKFNIQLNSAQTLYLRATAESSTTTEKAFFKNGADTYVVLAQTVNKPTVAAITDAKAATPVATNNANVIAYKVTGVTLTGATTAAPTYNATTNQYEIAGQPGATSATTTISTNVVPTTYSFNDSAGTYQAIVVLSSAAT